MQAFAEKSRKREEIKEERGRKETERERENREEEAGAEGEGGGGGREKGIATVAGLTAATVPPATDTSYVSGFLNNFSGERETVAKNI